MLNLLLLQISSRVSYENPSDDSQIKLDLKRKRKRMKKIVGFFPFNETKRNFASVIPEFFNFFFFLF